MSLQRVLAAELDLHPAPGPDQPVLARLTVGTEVMALSAPDALGWAKLKRASDGLTGFAFVSWIGPAPVAAAAAHAYEVTAPALELRSGPGTDYGILSTMPQGTLLTEQIPPTQGWMEVQVQADGRVGWCFAEYLRPAPAASAPAPVPASPSAATPTAAAAPAPAPAPAPSASKPSHAAPAPAAGAGPCYSVSEEAVASGGSPLVFDVSHFQGDVDMHAAAGAGLRGVIHKATEGTGFVDPRYTSNRRNASAAGLLWGAYHFAVAGDPQGQARFFLANARPDGATLLALDLEANPQGGSMSIAEARDFVTYVHNATGKWPVLYGGSYLKEKLGNARDPVLANCCFWLAQYDNHPTVPATWRHWTLWQYTDGRAGIGPHEVAGVPGGACDRDRFAGDEAALTAFWKGCGV